MMDYSKSFYIASKLILLTSSPSKPNIISGLSKNMKTI